MVALFLCSTLKFTMGIAVCWLLNSLKYRCKVPANTLYWFC